MKKSVIYLLVIALSANFTILSLYASAAIPNGAIPVKKCERFKRKNFYCGLVKRRWIPGRMIAANVFYSNAAERKNLLKAAKRAKGKKKEKLLGQADDLQARIIERSPYCWGGPKSPTPTPTATPALIRFDFSGAIGLGIGTPRDIGTGRLVKVDSSGKVSSAIVSGSTEVSGFYIAPNHKIYVGFMEKTSLSGRDPDVDGCYFAEINRTTGLPACIDSECAVNPSPETNGVLSGSDAFFNQSDSDGAMYFTASCNNKRVLRKYPISGTPVTLTNLDLDAMQLSFWYLMPDKSILLSGHDLPLATPVSAWFKRLMPDGSVTTIGSYYEVSAPKKLPNGNLLVRYNDAWLYDPSTNIVDFRPYAGCTNFSHYYDMCYDTDSVHDVSDLCNDAGAASFCNNSLGMIGDVYTWNSVVYGVFGEGDPSWNTHVSSIMQIYPGFSPVSSAVNYITEVQGIQNYLILKGYGASSQFLLTLLNLETGVETVLLNGEASKFYNGHYHLAGSGDKIYFDGRASETGSNGILGRIDLNTKTAVIISSEAMVDFQAL